MKMISGILNKTLPLLLVLIFFSPSETHSSTKTVYLPLSIDYKILKSIVVKTAYKDQNQTAILLNENGGCQKITISEPSIRKKSEQILFETKVHIVAGTHILNNCVMPIEWEGYLALLQKPKLNRDWNLSFDTVDSTLYDKDHRSSKMTGIVWDLLKTQVYEYLEGISINLAPPVLEVKSILVEMLPADLQNQVHRMLESMRPGRIDPTAEALNIDILTEVVESSKENKEIETEQISKAELDALIDNWEALDSFLVYLITFLSNKTLSETDRQILLDTLLETRYAFVTNLLDGGVKRDFVREQFISIWEKLSPIFRSQLGDDPSKSVFGYLAFFTAADALSALDKISPTLGIEISRNGLIRLARLLAEDQSLTLDYHLGVNSELRRVLDLGTGPEPSGPVTPMEEIEVEGEGINLNRRGNSSIKKLILSLIFGPAWAKADKRTISFNDIVTWVFRKENFETYVERIKGLIERASKNALKDGKIEAKYHNLYTHIVLSTAWQESCLRQFRIRKRKVTYLLSYNRSSVGLMQINERVWRGMFDRHHLRWDIKYNAEAGCEILKIYITKYILDRIKKTKEGKLPDNDTFARIAYAMYNGGPDEFEKILERKRKGTFYSSDKLYFEKYSWVKDDKWENVGECLIGG